MSSGSTQQQHIERAARAIHAAFQAYWEEFGRITRRARSRFEARDWHAMQDDALQRLEVYPRSLERIVGILSHMLGDLFTDGASWSRMKDAYEALLVGERNPELARTFFNSTVRRVLSTDGVDPATEFFSLDVTPGDREPDPSIYRRYEVDGDLNHLARRILEDYRFKATWTRPETAVAELLGRSLSALADAQPLVAVETVRSLFFRNKGAYIIGRARRRDRWLPFVLPLVHQDSGIEIDAVLTDEDLVSIVFSFTRSYFHVETDCPRELILFLKSILPLKPVAELYMAIGLNKHGKTELFRSLQRHLSQNNDRFSIAQGARGMVMLVFTLSAHDVVFKVIRDRFEYPKSTTRGEVMNRYRLVFKRDRVGRLVDAQEFQQLQFDRRLFSPDLLADLTSHAASTVQVVGDRVLIRHLYTERKLVPLNIYVREASPGAAREAIVDYGNAIKELAAANIFPGDFLLKNFGVTRHGRVVFYDYDELCLVTDCRFRAMPPPRFPDEELDAETWFPVADHDIFPEEFRTFLGLPDDLRRVFEDHHGDLFTVSFWQRLQERHRRGEIMEFFPYPREQPRPSRDDPRRGEVDAP